VRVQQLPKLLVPFDLINRTQVGLEEEEEEEEAMCEKR
jgi:hypothetical protein